MILSNGATRLLKPTEEWRTDKVSLDAPADFKVDPSWYVTAREVSAAH